MALLKRGYLWTRVNECEDNSGRRDYQMDEGVSHGEEDFISCMNGSDGGEDVPWRRE